MKNILKLVHRFILIIMSSLFLLLILNLIFYGFWIVKYIPSISPEKNTFKTANALKLVNGKYTLPNNISYHLKEQNIWALLIDNDTQKVIWHTDNIPDNIPRQYSVADIAVFSHGYIKNYPVFTAKVENHLMVLGYPKKSYWKHPTGSWEYKLIESFPKFIFISFCLNIIFIFLIYIFTNSKFLKSVNPIIKGIQDLAKDNPVHLEEKGLLSELAQNINKTSEILQNQKEQLRNKDNARANWIAGVSHDIRTPLSMITGYTSQLKELPDLSFDQSKKLSIILKQSERIKTLINDLNLASKLEYDMQPFSLRQENAISVVRQVVVDFLNINIDEKFSIVWETKDNFISCFINIDKNLIKRALTNLIQNSINHNEDGCIIYVSVKDDKNNCIICIEDDGIGISDHQLKKLDNIPHYMSCNTDSQEQRHGLGLLIVKKIINAHLGKIEMEHSEHGGFKVSLIIPKADTTSGKIS